MQQGVTTQTNARNTGIELAEASTSVVLAAEAPTSAPVREGVKLSKEELQAKIRQVLERGPRPDDPAVRPNVLEQVHPVGVPLSLEQLMSSMVYDHTKVPHRYDKYRGIADAAALFEDGVAAEWKAKYGKEWREGFERELLEFLQEDGYAAPSDDNEMALVRAIHGNIGPEGERAVREYQERERQYVPLHVELIDKIRSALRPPEETPEVHSSEMLSYELEAHPDRYSVRSASHSFMRDLSYTQFWILVQEGLVDKVRFFGPDKNTVMVTTKDAAPGGRRTVKLVLPPDPELFDHLVAHGVFIDTGVSEAQRLGSAWLVQVARYCLPMFVFSSIAWAISRMFLDSSFAGRRVWVMEDEVAQWEAEQGFSTEYNLQFDTPIRPIDVNPADPSFIAWDDIHGIDSVKKEIEEAIAFLKNPRKLMKLGIRKIGGILLAGAPGTGKTLLAKALSHEADVPMFGCSGTDFQEMYVGMGASKIRKTFELLKSVAPCILFIDEFDALGMARGSDKEGSMGDEEAVNTINELLTQMDGFEANKAVLILAATNRPGVLDEALTRPGRFDRVVYMPSPDLRGRAQILQVHAGRRPHNPDINWFEIARAIPGYTGADIMGLINRSSRMAARAGHARMEEDDIYAAMEYGALIQQDELAQDGVVNDPTPEPIPPLLRKSIATYQAGKALLAYITPEFEEISRVTCCPYGVAAGYTMFVEDEDKSLNTVVTRADMESHLVVNLAGRAAEKLVLGDSEVTGQGAPDVFQANLIAREMVLSCGMGRKVGPVSLLEHVVPPEDSDFTSVGLDEDESYTQVADMSTEMARVAFAEVVELLEAAEAKAYYGLAMNWGALSALVDALLARGSLSGKAVAEVLEENGVVHFPDPHLIGFGWDQNGELNYPFKPEKAVDGEAAAAGEVVEEPPKLTGLAAKTWFAGTEWDAPRDKDGKFRGGWHWNFPYSVRKDLPEWYRKEVERYAY